MWCPVCKTEYQKGITICAECGSVLVEGTEDDFLITGLCELKDEETAAKLLEYLKFSGITNAKEKEEDGVYIITVPQSQAKQAEKLMRGFMIAQQDEQEKEALGAGNDSSGEKGSNETPEGILNNSSKTYTKKADEYKDTRTSGITFVIFGLIGIAYLVLCKLEILPLTYNDIVLVLLLCMFAFFIANGVASVIKSGKIKGQISEEEALTKEIKLWLDENITGEIVGSWRDTNVPDEENELIVISKIGEMLSDYYKQLDTSYLEMIADEYFNEKISGSF
ncbi:MAG: hypothetical protein HFH67_09895 [Lachnospiraceae bacterium]|nr:hypothetical protein [Lachnospiraceae bacterium]